MSRSKNRRKGNGGFYPIGRATTGERMFLIFPRPTRERLATTCFRGRNVCRAGNFFAWERFEALFHDLRDDIIDSARETIREDGNFLVMNPGAKLCDSFEIEYETPVGWESTDALERYREDELVPFRPNDRSYGQRVRDELADRRPAPLTPFVTFIADFRREPHKKSPDPVWFIFIRSIYPGRDIGELKDDITVREKVVFFDWEHPGVAA